jgi:hypothetical protein
MFLLAEQAYSWLPPFSPVDCHVDKTGGTRMKKLSRKQRLYQKRKSTRSMTLRRCANLRSTRARRRPNLRRAPHAVLIAPPHFVLLSANGSQAGSDVREFFEFIGRLRATTGPSLHIDMSHVRRMVVDAALLFKAELSRLVQTLGVSVSATSPRSRRTLQVLKQTAICDLLKLNISIEPDREDVVHWRIAEGPRASIDPNALAPVMDDIEQVTGLATHPVYQGIIESMFNCAEHAYKNHPEVRRTLPESPGWWVFQQVRDGTLSVVVCDLGIGINRALPLSLSTEPGLLGKLMHLARRTKGLDCRALLAAMEYGRSSTGLHQRGKGMRNAHAVVSDYGEGIFYAISNQGCYVYKKSKGQDGHHQTHRLRYSINGTILGWRLPLISET